MYASVSTMTPDVRPAGVSWTRTLPISARDVGANRGAGILEMRNDLRRDRGTELNQIIRHLGRALVGVDELHEPRDVIAPELLERKRHRRADHLGAVVAGANLECGDR